MIDRRTAVLSGAATLVAGIGQSHAQAEKGASSTTDIEAEIHEWISSPATASFLEVPTEPGKGSLRLPSSDMQVRKAAELLAATRSSGPPIAIAKDLIARLPESWRMEWPRDRPSNPQPANPMIISFFAATKTDPAQGDQTAWCAAFMCWNLKRANFPHPANAGSRSFRNWFDKVQLDKGETPEIGDIVVFRSTADANMGHVAFFDGYADAARTRVYLIGGNQSDRLERANWLLDGGGLRFDSFRTTKGLREA